MNKLANPPAPSAEIPHLSVFNQTCAQLLQQGRSLLAVMRTALPVLLAELRARCGNGEDVRFKGLVKMLDGMSIGSTAGLLLHAIPRKVLESLILHTVAYDHCQSRNRDYGHGYKFDSNDQGVYVVGISIEGRDGKFLTGNELGTLSRKMQEYVDCSNQVRGALDRNRVPDPNAKKLVESVDAVFGEAPDGTPSRFVPSTRAADAARELIRTLERAHRAATDMDASGNTQTIQSPCYVGCSEDLWGRKNMYNVSGSRKSKKTALSQVSKLYGLTVSLLVKMRLPPRAHFVTVLRTWEPNQIQVAEELVSVLARAYVSQFGFNIRSTGHSPARKQRNNDDSGQYVAVTETYLQRNLARSKDEAAEIKALLNHQAQISKIPEHKAEIDRDLAVAKDLIHQGEQVKEFRATCAEEPGKVHERLESHSESSIRANVVMEQGMGIIEKLVSHLRENGHGIGPDE